MKKQILNVGKVLSKSEQKSINAGAIVSLPIEGCPLVLLVVPPEGCRWVAIPVCKYKLVCDAITAF